jgi:hypothetical protein
LCIIVYNDELHLLPLHVKPFWFSDVINIGHLLGLLGITYEKKDLLERRNTFEEIFIFYSILSNVLFKDKALKERVRTAKKSELLIDRSLQGANAETTVFVIQLDISKRFKNGTFSIRDKNEYHFFTLDSSLHRMKTFIY